MSVTATRSPEPAWRARGPQALLGVGLLFNALYAVVLLIDAARPRAGADEPALAALSDTMPVLMRVVVRLAWVGWAVAAGIESAVALRRRGAGGRWLRRLPADRVLHLGAAIVLLVPFAIHPVRILAGHPLITLLCAPTTAFGIWTVRRFQRWRRSPWWLAAAVFGWGAVIAAGFGVVMNSTLQLASISYYAAPGRLGQALHWSSATTFVSAGTMEELGKGAAVGLAYLLFRRHLDGVVAGLVLGGLTGLGFNLTETVLFMTADGGAGAGLHYWIRQSFALLGAHTAFSAVVGAGFGLATALGSRRRRVLVVAAGYLAAAGVHFADDVILDALSTGDITVPIHGGALTEMLLVQPLTLVVLQGPLVAVYLVLLRQGSRGQAARLAADLRAAAADPAGGIRPAEVPVLLSPRRRTGARLAAWRRHGWEALAAVRRLHAAQYELAATHREEPERLARLRLRIAQQRRLLGAAMTAARATKAAA
ncbi:PrsW family glutamic-type intramembrane protease [Actinoplanes teichomyceticus]|uniref:RsiW-degrading membrane proteinase PrsW (M82 family) n=1 Tax=Actinoplanes teichomyceticus TaxID=1867 RepID=A0A561WKH0_ACTTI|nr:PrsW family glutamic-type intramembrane protease [Actinoplanes teichomyceticus]TWG24366.1 RsiW-degrading membrane proteinase PrsW (M82 family) [Actinoplanes teichomyceticus]GIF12782.1 hypothetical protein Ate01nite_28140 [Actinoplanes teichomyceticus]